MELNDEEKAYQRKVNAEVLATQIKRTSKHLRNMRGIRGFFKLAPRVVREVEELGLVNKLKGADKKALAIDTIIELIPVKTWPWWMPKALARILLSIAIEQAVTAMNKILKKKFG